MSESTQATLKHSNSWGSDSEATQSIDATGCAATYAAAPATPVSGSWRECEAQESQDHARVNSSEVVVRGVPELGPYELPHVAGEHHTTADCVTSSSGQGELRDNEPHGEVARAHPRSREPDWSCHGHVLALAARANFRSLAGSQGH